MNPSSQSAAALARVRVVLVHTTHPGNIGAAARAMWTMGLRQLVLVMPERFPHADATALATGAAEVLANARIATTLRDALAGCALAVGLSARARAFAGRVLPIRDAAEEVIGSAAEGDVALVFGTEMSGLSNDELARCTTAATIAANSEFGSLNLAAAVQVAAYETRVAALGDDVWSAPRFAPATGDAIAGLYAHAERTFVDMRFLHPEMPRPLMPRIKRLFARAGLEREEVNILRGILARIDQLIWRAK